MKKSLVALASASLVLAAAGAASADTQTLTATVANTVTIDSAPADQDLGTLPVTGASIGSITVSSNVGYTLTVNSDVATMTHHNGTAYDSTRALSSSLVLGTTLSSGTGVPVASVPVSTTATAIATNPLSGLLSETDVYDLAVTQAATALDPAGTYRMVVTYTASEGV